MNSDPFHLVDVSQLYPPFLAKMRLLAAATAARGQVYFANSTYRSVEQQDALYAQGRTKPGAIVTNARGGQSAHNFAIAMDWTHDADNNAANGLQQDWTPEQYRVLAEEAVKLGLDAGFNWAGFPDRPHVNLNIGAKNILLFPSHGPATGAPDLLTIYQQGGLAAVHAFLDQYQW